MKTILLKYAKNQKGTTLVVVAIMLVVIFGITALAVDVGYIYAARTELQNIADSAALAAARQIGTIYESLPRLEDQRNYVCDKAAIVSTVQAVAARNEVADRSISIRAEDVMIGHWAMAGFDDNWCIQQDNGTCQPAPAGSRAENLNNPDAVSVTVRRDGLGAEGPLSTIFARVLGVNTVDVTATATAALTGKSKAGPGELIIPVGISRHWFTRPEYCNDRIRFSPTNDPLSCAGWNTYTYDPPNDNRLGQILQEDDRYPSPETIAGETIFNFIGGKMSNNTFEDMMLLYRKYGFDQDAAGRHILGADGEALHYAPGHPQAVPLCQSGEVVDACTALPAGTPLFYPDGQVLNKHHWPTYVVVYNWDDCSNPNKPIEIVGFAEIDMTMVVGPPDKILEGVVLCDYVDPNGNRGGGGNYGLKGSIPGLVE